MGWFRRGNPSDREELDRVKADLRSLRDAIAAHDQRRAEVAASAPLPPPADRRPEPSNPSDRPDPNARLDELAGRLEELANRAAPADPSDRIEELAAKVAELDQRVTSVSTELANQLAELGNEIDGLAKRPPEGRDETLVEELRDSQERLAYEQARYQIAFREDLARLAEQLRRR